MPRDVTRDRSWGWSRDSVSWERLQAPFPGLPLWRAWAAHEGRRGVEGSMCHNHWNSPYHPRQAGLSCGTHKWLILSEMAGHGAQVERWETVYLGKAGKRVWEIAVSQGGHLCLPSV